MPVLLSPERTKGMLFPHFLGLLDAFILRSGSLIKPAMADPAGVAARQLEVGHTTDGLIAWCRLCRADQRLLRLVQILPM